MLSKNQKVDSECWGFKESWELDYFVQKNNNRPLCLICNKTVAVMKEYNIKWHYVTKHANRYEKFEGQVRKGKFQTLKKSIKTQQSVFIRASRDTLSNVKLSFKITKVIAKSCRPFSNGKFIKYSIGMFLDKMCPEKNHSLENASLFHLTFTRRIEDLFKILKMRLKWK